MKKECFMTGEVLDTKYMRRTPEGTWVNTHLEDTTRHELGKSVVTSRDIQRCIVAQQSEQNWLDKAILTFRRHNKVTKKNLVGTTRDVFLNFLDKYSLFEYEKTYESLTTEECIEILKDYIDVESSTTVVDEVLGDVNNQKRQKILDLYYDFRQGSTPKQHRKYVFLYPGVEA